MNCPQCKAKPRNKADLTRHLGIVHASMPPVVIRYKGKDGSTYDYVLKTIKDAIHAIDDKALLQSLKLELLEAVAAIDRLQYQKMSLDTEKRSC